MDTPSAGEGSWLEVGALTMMRGVCGVVRGRFLLRAMPFASGGVSYLGLRYTQIRSAAQFGSERRSHSRASMAF